MRGFAAAVLILIGAALTFPSSIAIWEQRVLTDREAFVGVGQSALRHKAVQDRLTEQISAEVRLVAASNGVALPANGVQGVIAQNQVEALTRTVVSQLPESALGEQVLIATHEVVLTVIDSDRARFTSSGDEVRVNFRPAIEQVIIAFQPVVPALATIELPPGTGEVVIVQEQDASIAFRAVRWFDGAVWYIALVPAACYLLAVLIARNRPFALLLAGLSLIVTAGGRIFFYQDILHNLITDGVAKDRQDLAPAAAGIYDTIAASLVAQDMLLLGAGAVMVAMSAAWWVAGRARGGR